jgi:tape measure domain-containing protein
MERGVRMSVTIEKEIVQMTFDGKGFKDGVKGSIDDLAALKKSFDFQNAQRSMAELERASRLDFSGMERSLSSLNSKISLVGVAAATVIANITTSVIQATQRLFSALVLTPVLTGLQEYETQLNAIQTILANTKNDNTTLEQVTAALNELNLYADKTIYNFTQMTDSIGKFTTAGVDLETSVQAIKGIANLAALSGANAEQASNAMYQLSQAISSGTVKLMDWNSVVNAGLGGQVFQDALKETARVHGVAVDTIIEQEGGFRNSLQTGWLTSEILLDTLAKFTGDLTEDQLLALGYTEDQIAAIIELGVTANDAATKIKTLTQLKDTMMEALQSGWSQTWAIVFGDFEQAKELWGGIGEVFGEVISQSSDARNSMLEFWAKAGGRDQAIQGFFNVVEAALNIINAFKEAVADIFTPLRAGDLLVLSRNFLEFSEKLKMASESLDGFKSIVRGFAAAVDIVRLVLLAVLKPIGELIQKLFPAAEGFLDTAVSVADAIVAFREFAIETGFFDNVVSTVIATVGRFIERVKELVQQFLALEVVQDIVGYFTSITKSDITNFLDGLLTILKAIASPFVILAFGAKALYEEIAKLEIIQNLVAWFQAITWQGIKDFFKDLAQDVRDFRDSVTSSEIVSKFLELLETFDGRRIQAVFDALKENFDWIPGVLATATEAIEKFFGMGSSGSAGAAAGFDFDKLLEDIKKGIVGILDYFIEAAKNIDYNLLFKGLNTGIFAALALTIRDIFAGGGISDIIDKFVGKDSVLGKIGESVENMFGTMESALTSLQSNVKADTLQKIAIAIALLVGSLALLTFLNQEKLLAAAATVAIITAGLFGTTGALAAVNTTDALRSVIAMVGVSAALLLAAAAMTKLSELDPVEIERGVTGMVAGLGSLIVSTRALMAGDTGGLIKTVGLLLGLVLALKLISGVILTFGEMDPAVLQQGLLGVVSSLLMLVASMGVMTTLNEGDLLKVAVAISTMAFGLDILATSVSKFGLIEADVLSQGLIAVGVVLAGVAAYSKIIRPEGMIAAGAGLLVMSGAMVVMSFAIEKLGGMSWDELGRGLTGLAVAMLGMVLAANAMVGALPGAAAMIIMSASLIVIAAALLMLSAISWEGLAVGLVAIVAVILILSLAAAALSATGAIVALFALGAALLIIGAAAALVGAGLFLAALGLVAISGSAVAVGGAIGILGLAIIELLPGIAVAIAEAMVGFLTTIAENTPRIIEAMKTIILGMIKAITELIPDIVLAIWDMLTALLEVVAERLPDLVQAGFDILLAFIQGIADNIQDVVAAGLDLLTNFLAGIEDGIPALVDQAFSLILTFITAMADAVDEYLPQIIEAGGVLGDAIVDGMVQAVNGGLADIIAAITGIGEAALTAIKAILGIESPSTEFAWVAKMCVDGFVDRIVEGQQEIHEVISHLAEGIKEHLHPVMEYIHHAIEEELEPHLTPTITPVLHIDDKFKKEAASLSSTLAGATGVSIANKINASREQKPQPVAASLNNTKPSGECGVSFIQNNYSPKALDRAALYRQTKTQVARFSSRAFS